MRVLFVSLLAVCFAFPLLAAEVPRSGMLLGNVWIDGDEHSIRVAVDRDFGPSRADGIADDEFILWTEAVPGRLLHDEIDGVLVRFWPEKVVLLSRKEGRALLIAMNGAPKEQGPSVDELRADAVANSISLEEFAGGFGLTFRTGLSLPYESLQQQWRQYNQERFGIRTSDVHASVVCAAGGCGSVECSYQCERTACSVSCNSNFSYSCCGCTLKTAICSCVNYPCQ